MDNPSSVYYAEEDEFLNMKLKPSYMVEDYMEIIQANNSDKRENSNN